MPAHKALTGLKVTDEATGTVQAVFATLNVIDKDGDVTQPGAFRAGQKVRISAYNHTSWQGALPVGMGTIAEAGDLAILTGQFFLDTLAGKDTYATVKALGDLGEWSYGYDAVNTRGVFGPDDTPCNYLSEIEVYEVCPVILGAGIDTRTLAMKSAGRKLSEHAEAVLTDLAALADRVDEVAGLRLAGGKTLGSDTLAVLARYEATMKRLRDVLTTEPPKQDDEPNTALLHEVARYEARRATTLTT